MADRKMVPVEPKEPTAAQPAEGQVSQDEAQKLADLVSKALADVTAQLQKVLMVLQKMGLDPAQLQGIAQAYQAFENGVTQALGGGGEEAPEAAEGGGPVSQEGGVTGKPVV